MIEWIDAAKELPNEHEYVLVYVPQRPWLDSKDTDGKRFAVAASIVTGISKEERKKLKEAGDKRGYTYTSADEDGNNLVPYCWSGTGPSNYFGQEVSHWARINTPDIDTYTPEQLPEIPKELKEHLIKVFKQNGIFKTKDDAK